MLSRFQSNNPCRPGKACLRIHRAKTIIYISERFSLLKCGFKPYQVRRMEVTSHSTQLAPNSFENLATK